MPINAPIDYYKLGEDYSKEKDPKEKERILLEMIKLLPKHKGSEKELASLKRRLSLLRKASSRRPLVHRTVTIKKKWPRVCLLGYEDNIIKRFNLSRVDSVYHGIVIVNDMHIQVVAMTDQQKYREIFNQSEIVISKVKIDTSSFNVVAEKPDIEASLRGFGIIRIYTENSRDAIPFMKGDSVRALAKDLGISLKKNGYAIVYGYKLKFQGQRVGLDYKMNDGDRIWIKT